MTFREQLTALLHSRKFWALVTALVSAVAALATGEINTWQALQAALAALAVYSTGVALEDMGRGKVS